MGSKWRVRQTCFQDWIAIPPDRVDFDPRTKLFRTHPEALAYADRAARTVEVTLPRVTDRAVIPQREDMGMGINWSILAEWDSRGGKIDMAGPYGGMYVYQQDLENLGTYLLALARRKEQA